MAKSFGVSWSLPQALFTEPSVPLPVVGEPISLAATSERIGCRFKMLADLARGTDSPQRDAIRRLWVLSKCKTCGECADMSER